MTNRAWGVTQTTRRQVLSSAANDVPLRLLLALAITAPTLREDRVAKGVAVPEAVSLEPADEAGIRELMRNRSGKLRLVNVWATWCGPCVQEFPALLAIDREYRGPGFELVTISADEPARRESALAFLRQQHASARNVIFAKDDPEALVDLIDPEWAGELPHTILIAPGGRVIYRSDAAFDPARLKKEIVDYLNRRRQSRTIAQPNALATGVLTGRPASTASRASFRSVEPIFERTRPR
jgi:thiol-disulfide isomerase/thioredoxin